MQDMGLCAIYTSNLHIKQHSLAANAARECMWYVLFQAMIHLFKQGFIGRRKSCFLVDDREYFHALSFGEKGDAEPFLSAVFQFNLIIRVNGADIASALIVGNPFFLGALGGLNDRYVSNIGVEHFISVLSFEICGQRLTGDKHLGVRKYDTVAHVGKVRKTAK